MSEFQIDKKELIKDIIKCTIIGFIMLFTFYKILLD